MPSYDHPTGTFKVYATPAADKRDHGDFTIAIVETGTRVAYVVDWRADDGVTDPSPLSDDDDVNPFEVFDATTKRYISTTHSLRGACAVAASHYAKGK